MAAIMSHVDQGTIPNVDGEAAMTESERLEKRRRCSMTFHGNKDAIAINYLHIARGAVLITNFYLTSSLIHLACRAAGGFGPDDLKCVNNQLEIYGMKPAALVSNMILISTLLSTFFMPVFGAIIDYTTHRKLAGVMTAGILAVITGIQVATVQQTWFAMLVLQSICLAVYQIQVMITVAYYPEMASEVGERRMVSYSSTWSFSMFCSEAGVNIVIIVLIVALKLDNVTSAWLGQGVGCLFGIVFFTLGWRLPNRPRKHRLPKGSSLLSAGFKQNIITAKKIWGNYTGFKWFLVSTLFGQAAAAGIGTLAVIFLNGHLGMNSLQIGVFIEMSLIGVVFGTKLGGLVTKLTNAKTCLILSEIALCATVSGGVWLVQDIEIKQLAWIWGFTIGLFLGFFYVAETVFFSMCVPKNQEAELSGFYKWASAILSFGPPLVYSAMVQSGLSLVWAQTVCGLFFVPGIFFLFFCGSWEKILEEAKTVMVDFQPESDGEGDSEVITSHDNIVSDKELDDIDPEKPQR